MELLEPNFDSAVVAISYGYISQPHEFSSSLSLSSLDQSLDTYGLSIYV